MQTQTQQPSQVEQDRAEHGVQHESHVCIDATPQVCQYRNQSQSQSRSQNACEVDDSDGVVYASFNLQSINAPVLPKWKHNDHILEEYKKFCHSCQHIFDGPMAHVTSSKVKTNMRISTTISNCMTMRCMTLIMLWNNLNCIVNLHVTLELPDIISVKCLNKKMK